MKIFRKKNLAPEKARKILEPGPVVLVTSQWAGCKNIMAMGWHTVMEFNPSLFGCVIASSNTSFEMIRRSKQCAINVPTAEMVKKVIGIGTSSGSDIEKFSKFSLTPQKATIVEVPLIKECFANFECRLHDDSLVKKYNFFIFKIVAARTAISPKNPKTLHYYGEGIFTVSGKMINLRREFHGKSL